MNVFVSITLDRQAQPGLEAFENAVRKLPEVMECYLMTGELRLPAARSSSRISRTSSASTTSILTRLPSVARVHSSFAVRPSRARPPFRSRER